MKTKESIYIKILLWAYERSADGFTETELSTNFGLNNDPGLYRWYLKVFRGGTNDNPSIIDHFKTINDIGYFCLTEKGMSAAIDYLELKEAQASGRKETIIAIISILIGVIVGVIQIYLSIFQIQTQHNESKNNTPRDALICSEWYSF